MTTDYRRRASIGFVLALGMLVSAGACRSQTEEEVESEAVVSVKTTAAVTGSIRGVVHATGVVNPAPGAELVVIAPEAARITEVTRAVGDRTRRGDVLVRFEIPGSMADLERQQAEVKRAQSDLENAKAAQTRSRGLFERGVAARKEVEESDRAVADAEATLAQARASLGASQTIASRAVVRATFDGIVASRHHNPGDLVEPTASDAVLDVIDPRRLEVLASVPLTDAPRVEVGASARISAAPFDPPDVGLKVLSRPAAVEAGTATVPVRLGFNGVPNIPSGTPLEVDIDAEKHDGVVLVPSVAVVREGEETAVFVAAGGKAQRRAVHTGLTDGTNIEIVSGIKTGDMVIVEGQAGLPDGAAITAGGDKAAGDKDEAK